MFMTTHARPNATQPGVFVVHHIHLGEWLRLQQAASGDECMSCYAALRLDDFSIGHQQRTFVDGSQLAAIEQLAGPQRKDRRNFKRCADQMAG